MRTIRRNVLRNVLAIVPESKQTPEGLRVWLKQEIDKWGR